LSVEPELIPSLGSQPAGDDSHKHCPPLLSARPVVTSEPLPNYTAWRQRHMCISGSTSLVVRGSAVGESRPCDLLIASPTPHTSTTPLSHTLILWRQKVISYVRCRNVFNITRI